MMYRIMVKSSKLILDELGLSPKGAIHKLLDEEVERRCRVYVPRKDGFLEASGTPSLPEIGFVTWDRPYAKYQYYGLLMVGKKNKILTNKPLKSHGGGLRGAKWFERMKIDCIQEILNTLKKAIGRKAK
ncbi:MAG: hypothetical protein E7399_03030 [Ruminococcaceae bacterium]|nr:hypothetical protein [Oscillospiraceae bacterium]